MDLVKYIIISEIKATFTAGVNVLKKKKDVWLVFNLHMTKSLHCNKELISLEHEIIYWLYGIISKKETICS